MFSNQQRKRSMTGEMPGKAGEDNGATSLVDHDSHPASHFPARGLLTVALRLLHPPVKSKTPFSTGSFIITGKMLSTNMASTNGSTGPKQKACRESFYRFPIERFANRMQ